MFEGSVEGVIETFKGAVEAFKGVVKTFKGIMTATAFEGMIKVRYKS